MLQKEHPVYLETVAFRNIAKFTLLQLVYMLAVWGVTWAGAFGIAFPFLIVLLIPARQYIMPLVRRRPLPPCLCRVAFTACGVCRCTRHAVPAAHVKSCCVASM